MIKSFREQEKRFYIFGQRVNQRRFEIFVALVVLAGIVVLIATLSHKG
jgi:hypothetical protein